MTRARSLSIWLSGTLASMIVGGAIGDWIQPYGGGAFWGWVAGACAFICFRLWTTQGAGPTVKTADRS